MSKSAKPVSLKLLFALSSTVCVFFTVIIGYSGLTAYGEYQTREIEAELSPSARRAQESIDAGQVPNQVDTSALMRAYENWGDTLETNQNIALVVLSMLAASLGAGLSLILAERLARPIQAVASAARQITQGDLTARATAAGMHIGESAQLVTDFNQMACALEGFEREMNQSSAAIAHELRTPLTVLRGYVQGAIDGVFPPTNTHLALLMVHIENLTRVVDDLQTLSLANNGALCIAAEPMDAAFELGRLLDAMEPAVKADHLRIERDLQTAAMRGDPTRLRQAAAALIDNARHYAANGKSITVQTRAEKDGIVIRVLDSGPGLSENDLLRSTERFWRGEPSRGKHSGGSGLGLSVVKAIVTAHGGDVRITNRPSGGLCVALSFPYHSKPTARGELSR